MNIFTAKLIANNKLTDGIYQLVFRLDSDANGAAKFDFVAGQFVMIQADIDGEMVKRAYSISSIPTELPQFELTVRRYEEGLMSCYLTGLHAGAEIEFSGAMGVFNANQNKINKTVLIATGCGIAPLKSLLTFWLAENPDMTVSLFFGNRFEDQIPYHNWFKDKLSQRENFFYYPCISQGGSDKVKVGRVTKVLPEVYRDFADSEFYICGSLEMMQEMTELIEKNGGKRENIYFENVFPAASK